MSGPTDGAAAGVAASGDQTEGAEGEDNKGEHLLSCTSSLMLPVKWRVGDVSCLTYFTQSHIHHKHDDSFLSCHSSLYGVTEYDQQRTRDIGVTK